MRTSKEVQSKPTPKKKAKLVTLEIITRVIINDTDPDEVAVQRAWDKIAKDPMGYMDYDNVIDIEDDDEMPYDPERDDKEIMQENTTKHTDNMEKQKNPTKKQIIALTYDALLKYREYLADGGNTPMLDETLRERFAIVDIAKYTDNNTANALLGSFSQVIMIIGTEHSGFPELNEIWEDNARIVDELYHKENALLEETPNKINNILASEGLHLAMGNIGIDTLTLCHPYNESFALKLGLAEDYTVLDSIINPYAPTFSFFENTDRCAALAEYYADLSRLFSDKQLRDRIKDVFVAHLNTMNDIRSQSTEADVNLTQRIKTTVYERFRTFAKDILDFEIPEYRVLF